MSSAAKRAAARAAQAEAPAQDLEASAARTRPISVHLTPLAPGLSREPITSKRRWATFYGKTPQQVVMATLKRCRLAPAAVTSQPEVNGDVLLMAEVAPEFLRLVSAKRGELAPYAIIWDGMTARETQEALAALVANGWTPPAEVEA